MLLALKILKLKGFVVYSLPSPSPPIPQPLRFMVPRLVETHLRLLRITTSFKDDGYSPILIPSAVCVKTHLLSLQILRIASFEDDVYEWTMITLRKFVLFSIDLVHLDVDAPPYTVRKFQHFTYIRFSEVSDCVFGKALMCRVFRQVWWTGHIFKRFAFVEFMLTVTMISMWALHHFSFLLGLLPVTGLALRLPLWSA